MLDSANYIQVCGTECVLRTDLSDQSYAVCEMPSLATSYSVENYKVAESVDLAGTIFPEESALLHDGLTVESYESTSNDCEFGMTFKEGHVGVLDEAKIFINFLTSKTPYVDNLEFQGSDDGGSTWTSLHTFGEELHEGWNYIDYRDDDVVKPGYNSYRFAGSESGACRITEYKLHGVEAMAESSDSHVCTPKIFLGTTELTSTTPLNDVTYSAASTPKLLSISPRFGSVLGGTTVTLTGENLLGGATTVLFDDRECTVTSASATEIVCTSDDKPYVPDTPVTKIEIEGLGLVATQGLVYRYVSLWSDTETWGGDIPPMEGESIHVPAG